MECRHRLLPEQSFAPLVLDFPSRGKHGTLKIKSNYRAKFTASMHPSEHSPRQIDDACVQPPWPAIGPGSGSGQRRFSGDRSALRRSSAAEANLAGSGASLLQRALSSQPSDPDRGRLGGGESVAGWGGTQRLAVNGAGVGGVDLGAEPPISFWIAQRP
jgi:hypothetical protein